MSTFDDRERAFEAKFAHDADMLFKAEARANKLLGLWAAELLGHSGLSADRYAATVVASDMEEAGDANVIRKVAADLEGKATAEDVRGKRLECLTVAKEQLTAES